MSGSASGASGGAGGVAKDYAPVEVDFVPDPGFQLLFDGLSAEEELGRPFLINLDLSSGKRLADVDKLIGSSCSIWMYQQEAKDPEPRDRYFHGIVTALTSGGLVGGAYRYKLEVRPWVFLLKNHVDCRIFNNKSAFEIVTQVFRDAGFSDFEDKRQAACGDQQLVYTVQYNESSLAFVTRLMELYGFYYFFKFNKDKHTLVLADDPNCHELLKPEIPLTFDSTEYRTVDDHIWQWSIDHGLNSGKYTSQDYNFTTPSADLTAKNVQPQDNSFGSFETYEYPGHFDNTQHGSGQNDVRMQELISRREIYNGQSNSRKLRAGWCFTLNDEKSSPPTRGFLIIHSLTTVQGTEGNPNPDAENVDSYRVDLKCIPAKTHFRLQRTTQRPMIRGTQTAHVVGQPGEAITTDKHGRVKVKFPWDRSSTADHERTCWVRTSQAWAGSNYGAMFIPRVGQEVLVSFMEGNPDRPVIGGTVYNGNNNAHHGPAAHKTRTVIRSATTAGSSDDGANGNELHFEDSTGGENLYMRAQKDFTVDVKHNQVVTIDNDRSVTIKAGNDTLMVTAGSCSTTAATTITLTVLGTSITISGSSVAIAAPSVAITSPVVTISGNLTVAGAVTASAVTAGAMTAGTVTAGAVITAG